MFVFREKRSRNHYGDRVVTQGWYFLGWLPLYVREYVHE